MVEVVAVPEDAFVENPKLEDIFSSIEKQLIKQTGFLKSMQSLQASQVKFTKDLVNDAERTRLEDSVGKGDLGDTEIPAQRSSDDRGQESVDSGSPDTAGGGRGLGLIGGALGALSIKALTSSILKGGIATLLAPVIIDFVVGAVKEVFGEGGLDLGIDPATMQKVADAVKEQSTFIIGATVIGKLFKKSWLGFALSTGWAIGGSLSDWLDTNKEGLIETPFGDIDPGVMDNFGRAIGVAVSGGLVLLSAKITKSLGIAFDSIKTKMSNFRVPKLDKPINPVRNDPGAPKSSSIPSATTKTGVSPAVKSGALPAVKSGAAPAVKSGASPAVKSGALPAVKSGALPAVKSGAAPRMMMKGQGSAVPSGMTLNSSGKVISKTTGRFQSISQIVEAMEADGRTAKLAKYAKFFKFAGPAMAVLPALIDPAMAIYNDEPEDVVRKEIGGALGSISGAYLGGLAGAAATTFIPVVGQSGIGNILGGIVGAIGGAVGGEYAAEHIADALMGGPAAEPVNPAMITKENFETSYTRSGESALGKYTAPDMMNGFKPIQDIKSNIVPSNVTESTQTVSALESGVSIPPESTVSATTSDASAGLQPITSNIQFNTPSQTESRIESVSTKSDTDQFNSERVINRFNEMNIQKIDSLRITKDQLSPVIPISGKLDAINNNVLKPINATKGTGVNVVNSSGGNTNNTSNVGGSSSTVNVFQSNGSNALANHLPSSQTSN